MALAAKLEKVTPGVDGRAAFDGIEVFRAEGELPGIDETVMVIGLGAEPLSGFGATLSIELGVELLIKSGTELLIRSGAELLIGLAAEPRVGFDVKLLIRLGAGPLIGFGVKLFARLGAELVTRPGTELVNGLGAELLIGLGIELLVRVGAKLLISLDVKLLVGELGDVAGVSVLVVVVGGKKTIEVLVIAIDTVEFPASISCWGELATGVLELYKHLEKAAQTIIAGSEDNSYQYRHQHLARTLFCTDKHSQGVNLILQKFSARHRSL